MKNRLLIAISLTVVLSGYLIYMLSSKISMAIINTAEALILKENTMFFKRAFTLKEKMNVDLNDLIVVEKNSRDEIVSVDFKIDQCEKIMMAIVEDVSKNTNIISDQGYVLYIPLGYVTNSPLLLNLGPKIPVKISTTDVALGEVSTRVRDFGINNALVELYINIEIETNAIVPLKSGTTKQNFSFPLASKVIAGSVPSFYNGKINSTSETFNLPIK